MSLFTDLRQLLFTDPRDRRKVRDRIKRGEVWRSDFAGVGLVYNPDDLVQAKGLKIYKDMATDETVKAGMWLLKLALLVRKFNVLPATSSRKDIKAAEFCRYVLTDAMKGSFRQQLWGLLSFLDFGFVVAEKMFTEYTSGDWRGYTGFSDLKARDPESIEFRTDDHGNVREDGILQNGVTVLPSWKMLHLAYGDMFGNPYGRSMLREAYTPWISKTHIRRYRNMFLERWAVIGLDIEYERGDAEGRAAAEALLDEYVSAAGIARPSDITVQPMPGAERAVTSGELFDRSFIRDNAAIMQALLIPDQLGFQAQETGSYKQAEVHLEMFLWFVDFVGEILAEAAIRDDLFKDLVDLNFPQGTNLPIFKWGPLSEGDKLKIAHLFNEAVQYGTIKPSEQDETHFRRLLNFPVTKDTAEALATFAEDPTDYDSVQSDFNSGEWAGTIALAPVVLAIRTEMTTAILRKSDRYLHALNEEVLSSNLESLQVPHVGELRDAFMSLSHEAFEMGQRQARGELHSSGLKVGPVTAAPAEAYKLLEEKAFWMAGIESDYILVGVKEALLEGFRQGWDEARTMKEIQKFFNQYEAPREVTPSRIRVVVRTNYTDAYNQGRLMEYRDPALEGMVIGVRFSAILDDRTTEICKTLHNTAFALDDPMMKSFTPPMHFNCRSLLTPIFKWDTMAVATQKDKARFLPLIPEGFS